MIHRLPTNSRQTFFHLWARLQTDATTDDVISLNHAELCESVVFYTVIVVWLCSWMNHRMPTNCWQKLFQFWAWTHTDATINEIISLNRAELCESVVFLHSQSILTMLMNDSHTADEMPTKCRRKLFHLWARLDTDGTINVVIPLNRAELCESVVFLHSQCSLTVCMNDPQTADELPTKIISFVGEAAHRRNHKWSNSSQ